MITEIEGRKLSQSMFLLGFEEYTTKEICEVLTLADDLYFNGGDSLLSDFDYDALKRYAQCSDPTNSYFLGVGSSIRGGKVTLPFEMGSLDQTYEGEIVDWIKKWNIEDKIGVVSDKLDGASAMVVYDSTGSFQIAYSRGNGKEGADISRHLSIMPSIKQKIDIDKPLVVRGENIISKNNFVLAQTLMVNKGSRKYKNARNMVSGLMNSSSNDSEVYQYIDFVAYEIVGSELSKDDQLLLLNQLGFKVVEYSLMVFGNMNDTSLSTFLQDRKKQTAYDIDGLVIEVCDASTRAIINPTRATLNPAFATKYKIADLDNTAIATVVDVEINISKHGYLKPRVQIVPVDLVGVTITWATGFNMRFIIDNQIGPGSQIGITRAGDVVPFIANVIQPMPIDDYDSWFYNKIEEFGTCWWSETFVDLVIADASNNDTVKYQQLIDFFNSIDAPYLGEGNLFKIFEMGFETPESIILLTQEDISSLVGSVIMGKKIFTGLREKLTNIPMYKLMGAHPAFGRGVGRRKMKSLYEAFAGDWHLCADAYNIMPVAGFDTKTADKIATGYPKFKQFVDEINHVIAIQPYVAPIEGKFTNKIIVFTGFRDSTLEKQVELAGGKMGSSVSSKTYMVVTNDPTGSSSKLTKARSLNIPVLNINEFTELL